MKRAKEGLSFTADHDRSKLIGRLTEVKLTADKALRSPLVYAANQGAKEVRADIEAGVRPGASLEYNIYEYREEKRADGLYIIATKWEPMGCSSVTIEADIDAGINREALSRDAAEGACCAADCADCTCCAACMAMAERAGAATNKSSNPNAKRNQAASEATNKESDMLTPEQIAAQKAAEQAARDAQATETREAAGKILEIAGENNIPMDEARKAIAENWSVDRFLRLALDKVRARTPNAIPDPDGVTAENIAGRSDAKRYSYARAVMAASDLKAGRTPEPSLEYDLSRELEKKTPPAYAARGGILIPMRAMNKRDGLDSITAGKGTELKQDMPAGELIELLANISVLNQMGMTVLTGLTGPIPFPKETGLPTHYWQGENPGAAAAKSNPSFATVSLNPKTLIGTVPFSRQLVILGNPSVEALVRKGLAKGAALALDKAGIYGIGAAGQPLGIYNAPDVNSKAMGGAVAFGELVDMATECANDNALLGSLGFITTPGMAGKLMQTLVASAAGSAMIWQGKHNEGIVAGYKAVSSNQLSATMTGSAETGGSEHGIIFGDFSNLVYGSWGIQELIVDNITRKGEAMIEVTSFEMADVLLRHGESFCKATGATLA
jgi:HK97 family phage major capsid protein